MARLALAEMPSPEMEDCDLIPRSISTSESYSEWSELDMPSSA